MYVFTSILKYIEVCFKHLISAVLTIVYVRFTSILKYIEVCFKHLISAV